MSLLTTIASFIFLFLYIYIYIEREYIYIYCKREGLALNYLQGLICQKKPNQHIQTIVLTVNITVKFTDISKEVKLSCDGNVFKMSSSDLDQKLTLFSVNQTDYCVTVLYFFLKIR